MSVSGAVCFSRKECSENSSAQFLGRCSFLCKEKITYAEVETYICTLSCVLLS